MARAIAPLLSLSATGKFANTLNFKNWGNKSVVRFHRKPRSFIYPSTDLQNFYTAYFYDLVKVWQNLNSTVKNALDLHVANKSLSGFNFFVRAYNLNKYSDFGVARYGFSEFGDLTL